MRFNGEGEDKPLYKLLVGGSMKRVKVYGSIGRLVDIDNTRKLCDWYLKRTNIVKIRFHILNPMEDVKVLKELKGCTGIR